MEDVERGGGGSVVDRIVQWRIPWFVHASRALIAALATCSSENDECWSCSSAMCKRSTVARARS